MHVKSRHLSAEHIVVGRSDAHRRNAESIDLLPGNASAVKGILDIQLRREDVGAFIIVIGLKFPSRSADQ